MSYTDTIRCAKCGVTTTYIWKKGIEYRCSQCGYVNDLFVSIMEGRFGNQDLQKSFDKKKKK